MPGINQLPAGSEPAAAISLIWASTSWLCSSLLLWLTWSHQERWSYLALLSISALFSNTFSIVQQIHDITWYMDIVTEQFERKKRLPPTDPELAIAGGSFGLDLVLYYLQYYSYNVQALLVMFWAAELCQLTYQVGERRKIRRIFRKVHTAGKLVSWLLPLFTILSLRAPGLKENFLGFILLADFPLMLSLAISSVLMMAVTLKYVQSRQKFTQWTPPKYNSASSSEAGNSRAENSTGLSSSSGNPSDARTANSTSNRGLYDRWLMVRFTIAFVLLAVFEVTNTLFQVTTLNNDIKDAADVAPDLSAGRATQTLFLFIPGTTPGIFLYIVFGTTAASRQKVLSLITPKRWREASSSSSSPSSPSSSSRGCWPCSRRRLRPSESSDALSACEGGITVQRSLIITSASRARSQAAVVDECSDPGDISLKDFGSRSESANSRSYRHPDPFMKPLPPPPPTTSSRFRTLTTTCGTLSRRAEMITTPAFGGGLLSIEEKSVVDGGMASRTSSDASDSVREAVDCHSLGMEHSDDSGPILPIQRPDIRRSRDIFSNVARDRSADRLSKNLSRPRK